MVIELEWLVNGDWESPTHLVNQTKKVLTISMAFITKDGLIRIILNIYGRILTEVRLHGNENEQNHQYNDNLFADKSINFIDRNFEKPFFLYLPVCIPHSRYELPDIGIYSHMEEKTDLQKKYAAMVTRLDETVGRIVKRLDALGIVDKTYIFFTSDNGPPEIVNDWEIFNSNGIYRGMKMDPYEGGIRVPFIVSHPKKLLHLVQLVIR